MQPDHWNEESLALLRLACMRGVGRSQARALLTAFGTASALWQDDLLGDRREVAASLREAVDPVAVERALRWRDTAGNHLIAWNDARYPALLREIADPPLVMYARGRVELLQRPSIAIVGSRNATAQGRHDAFAFARTLSDAGLCVVSGMALGIDASAHEGALAGGASSVAVLGTGIDRIYPCANRALAARLQAEGCIVTELAPGTPPLRGNFPVRNRLISGLSRGVLVIEAAMESGSLVTAKCALSQCRDVFAIPGSIHSPLTKGCHWLIGQGAKLTETVDDVLAELGFVPADAPASKAQPPARGSLLEFMGFAPISLEQLALRSGFGVAKTAEGLSRLEIEGEVAILAGGLFQRTPRASARH